MTLAVDKRKGSKELYPYIRDVPKVLSETFLDGDFEFLGYGPYDAPFAVGGEYKTFTEALTAMNDGRIYGTQIARMLLSYQRVYLVIEGRIRVAKDGVLEYYKGKEKGKGRGGEKEIWYTAYGRDGRGWTAREFFNRIESIEEFTGVRVRLTEDKHMSGELIANLYRYWQKLYSEHRSWAAWDQSNSGRSPGNVMIPTSSLPLVTRCAREIARIGQTKAHFVGAHFGTVANMVMASADDWAKVEVRTKIKSGAKAGTMRSQHLGEQMIETIMNEIWTGKPAGDK